MQSLQPTKIPDRLPFNGTSNELYRHAFNIFYTHLAYFCGQMLKDRAWGQDVATDTFIKLWKTLQINNEYKNEKNVKAFLFITAKRHCLNTLRHLEVRQRFAKEIIYRNRDWEEAAAIKNLIKAEVLAQICQIMETFPPARKRVFIMAYIGDMKNEEISDLLGISVSTVKTQKARCILALKKNVKKDS